jgi:DNA replication protein DnaC
MSEPDFTGINTSVLYDRACIPKRHKSFRVTDNNSPQWLESHNKVKESVTAGGICIVLGTRGSGKTQSSACAIGHCCQNLKKPALYTKAFDIFLSIRNGNNRNSTTTEQEEIERFIKPHLLVMDAFEVRGDTEFENRVLDHIIDRRYDDRKPTIIITNDSIENMGNVLGPSIMDRIRESGGFIKFKDSSHRAQ